MDRIELVSYAKINLTLEVLAKREDGFHEIDSVVQIIDLSDRLSISRAPGGVIEVSADAPGVPSGEANLVYRACEVFFASTGITGGAVCALEKRIPAQAGLGGGSGDAAAAVVGLDRLYGAGLPIERLAEIAGKVGSDAPLFVCAGTVRMRGRGERVEPLPDAPELQLVVVKPDVGVSTAWAYSELDRVPPERSSGAGDRAERAVRARDREGLIRGLSNDFDAVVSSAHPEISDAKRRLVDAGARSVLLCGSGSAVFGAFDSRYDAGRAAEIVSRLFRNVYVSRTLTRAESQGVVVGGL